jgi:hypothetical protein
MLNPAFNSFLRSLATRLRPGTRRRWPRRRPRTCKPILEHLEARTVPTLFTHVADVDGYVYSTSTPPFYAINSTGTDLENDLVNSVSRASTEFDVSDLPRNATLTSATFRGQSSLLQYNSTDPQVQITFNGYTGNGVIDSGDYGVINSVGSLTQISTGAFNASLSPSFVQSVVASPTAQFIGFTQRLTHGERLFMWSTEAASFNVTVPTLVLNYTVNGDNPPAVTNDAYTTAENTTLNVAAPGVLANDTDAEGQPLTAHVTSGPSHGTLNFNADGSFTYTPALYFYGTDSFRYRANDGIADSLTATVTLTVTHVNQPPVAVNDAYSVNENSTLVVDATAPFGSPVLHYGFDEASSGTTPALDDGQTPAANGTFVGLATRTGATPGSATTGALDLTGGTNSNNYVTAGDADKIDNLTAMTLTLWVNLQANPQNGDRLLSDRPPTIPIPPAGTKGWDWRISNSIGGASPTAGQFSLQFEMFQSSGSSANAQSQTFDGFSANQRWVFLVLTAASDGTVKAYQGDEMTAAGQRGVTSIFSQGPGGPNTSDFRVGGTASDPTVDHTPLAWFDDVRVYDHSLSSTEIESVRLDGLRQLATGVLLNDQDVDGDRLTAALVSGPAHGTLAFQSNGAFRYTPNAGFFGTDTFTYKANDGQLDSNVATVTLTVNRTTNQAPVAVNDSYSVNQGTALTVAAPGVLGNDTDADGDPLTAKLVSGPSHGSLTLNADGSFAYTPAGSYSGPDSFTYKANDGQADSNVATVSLTVQATAPVILDNGLPGYTEAGGWYGAAIGFGGSLRYAPAGNGSSTATWQASNLAAGTYLVQATWNGYYNHATNAPFSIYDGNTLLTTAPVSQQPDPNADATAGGFPFQTLATVTVTSGTLRVVLSDNANGYVVADAVRIAPTAAPTIDLNWSGGGLSNVPATATTSTPFTVTRTYTITNSNPANTVPAFTIGYYASADGSLANATLIGSETVPAGQAAGTYTGASPPLQFSVAGSYYLVARLDDGGAIPETNEGNNLTQSAQQVLVSGATILDNGQPGYSDAGGWSDAPLGYGGSLRYAAAGNGSATATWQATGLASGAYLVQATWNSYPNHATNAPFSIYDGNTLLTTVQVNQQPTPTADATVNGIPFQTIATVTVSSGTLRVVLSNNANGYVVADALRIAPTVAPTIDLNWSGGGLSGVPTTATTSAPFTVTRAYTVSNSGSSTVPSFTIGYYASPDGTLANASLIGSETVPAGQAAGTYTGTSPPLQFSLAGTYYLLARLDDGGTVPESNEGNNLTQSAQQVAVSGAFVLDNGHPGYSDAGGWSDSSLGYGGSLRYAAAGNGSATATWQASNLAAGNYLVQATWTGYANHATNAPFSIYDGNTLVVTVRVNQQPAPTANATVNGFAFQTLATVTIHSGTLRVVLSNDADGYVVADALRVAPL